MVKGKSIWGWRKGSRCECSKRVGADLLVVAVCVLIPSPGLDHYNSVALKAEAA